MPHLPSPQTFPFGKGRKGNVPLLRGEDNACRLRAAGVLFGIRRREVKDATGAYSVRRDGLKREERFPYREHVVAGELFLKGFSVGGCGLRGGPVAPWEGIRDKGHPRMGACDFPGCSEARSV